MQQTITVEVFFNLFIEELKQNKNLRTYYKFLNNSSGLEFRKAYFCQRLQYIYDNIGEKTSKIWDCGCGYRTTAIFLALNGIATNGSTLEFYYQEIPKRLEYWKKYGKIQHKLWMRWIKEWLDDPVLLEFIRVVDEKFHKKETKI